MLLLVRIKSDLKKKKLIAAMGIGIADLIAEISCYLRMRFVNHARRKITVVVPACVPIGG